MSTLRPEAHSVVGRTAVPDETALFLIQESVGRRHELIYGRLHDGKGNHCAIGSLWADNPKIVLNSSLIDEVASVNDSVPITASPKERWKIVNSWLRFKIRVLAQRTKNKE